MMDLTRNGATLMPSWVVEDARQIEAGEGLSTVRTGSAKFLLMKNLAEDTGIAIDAGVLSDIRGLTTTSHEGRSKFNRARHLRVEKRGQF